MSQFAKRKLVIRHQQRSHKSASYFVCIPLGWLKSGEFPLKEYYNLVLRKDPQGIKEICIRPYTRSGKELSITKTKGHSGRGD